MPSVSKKQQRFMGIVRAYQKGTLETEATPEVQRAAASMKKKDVKKFASTKHKGLPEKKVTKESFNEDAKMAKQSDDKLKAAHTKFSGMDKSPANTFMLKRIQREMNKRKRSVMKEDYVKELEDGLVKMEYPAYDEVDKLMQKIAKENGIDTTTLHMAFKTKHLMVPDDWAKRKMMEPVVIPKTPVNEISLPTNQVEKKPNPYGKRAVAKAVMSDIGDRVQKKVKSLTTFHKESSFDINPQKHKVEQKKSKIHNVTRANVNPNEKAAAENRGGAKLPNLNTEGNLHKWFKGSKSKDGKGGWVNVVTGGTCASDEPGEGTPKCVSSSKRASMTKAERASASRRKKKADPGQQSKSGAAKPTYVSTDKPKKKVNEDVEGRKTALTEPKSTKERLARKKDSEIRREAERSMYDSSAGESEIAKRTRIAKKLGRSTNPKNQDKGRQMEIDTTKKIVGEEFGKMTKEQEDIYVGNKAGRIKFDKITDYKKRKQLKKNLSTYEGDEDKTTTTSESYSSKSSDTAKKAKLTASIERLENLKVKKKMNEDIKMTKKAYNKLHKDFKSDDPKNPRTTKYNPKTGGTESHPVKFVDEAKKPMVKVKLKDPSKIKVKVTDIGAGGKEYVRKDEMQSEAAAWTRKAGKNSSGGLNEKGRKSYERENPGSDLKAPSKKKGNKRRASFCARMKGMKSKLTSAKTARDPDSRINKSLRAWNCSYEPENGEVISESKVAKMIKSLKRKTSVLEKGQEKNRDAGAIAAKIMKQKEHNKYVNFLPMNEGKKKCGEGEYYCNDDKKCKSIPKGYRVGYGGMLKPDNSDDDTKGKNGNGNGNGHGGNGNGGNGGGNGGGDGGGGE